MTGEQQQAHIGVRIRELRKWRGLTQDQLAGLSGVSSALISRIESGSRAIAKRATLEALALALRVSPAELTGKPYIAKDSASSESHAAVSGLVDALTGWWVGEAPDAPSRPWEDVKADVKRLVQVLRPTSDYAAQLVLLPNLIRDLLVLTNDPAHERDALIGLMNAYNGVANVAGRLGLPGLPTLAVERMRQASDQLGDPEWSSLASWARAHALSGTNRERQYALAVAVADDTKGRTEARGMANLTAALAAAAQGNEDAAHDHLHEAAIIAQSVAPDVSAWGSLQFGRTNVGIWRIAINVELGHGARVGELMTGLNLETITPSRQASGLVDYGRGLIAERKTREQGLHALLQAEAIAPQQVRNNVFVREAVTALLTSARREAGGRDLRGLAYRLGVGPKG